jgi:hypothetical protein
VPAIFLPWSLHENGESYVLYCIVLYCIILLSVTTNEIILGIVPSRLTMLIMSSINCCIISPVIEEMLKVYILTSGVSNASSHSNNVSDNKSGIGDSDVNSGNFSTTTTTTTTTAAANTIPTTSSSSRNSISKRILSLFWSPDDSNLDRSGRSSSSDFGITEDSSLADTHNDNKASSSGDISRERTGLSRFPSSTAPLSPKRLRGESLSAYRDRIRLHSISRRKSSANNKTDNSSNNNNDNNDNNRSISDHAFDGKKVKGVERTRERIGIKIGNLKTPTSASRDHSKPSDYNEYSNNDIQSTSPQLHVRSYLIFMLAATLGNVLYMKLLKMT